MGSSTEAILCSFLGSPALVCCFGSIVLCRYRRAKAWGSASDGRFLIYISVRPTDDLSWTLTSSSGMSYMSLLGGSLWSHGRVGLALKDPEISMKFDVGENLF